MDSQYLACDCGQLLLQELPQWELDERERNLPGEGGEVTPVQPQHSLAEDGTKQKKTNKSKKCVTVRWWSGPLS